MQHLLQDKQLKLLFPAFIRPYLGYGALVWEGAAITHVNKLDRKTIRLDVLRQITYCQTTL